jgi:hypothetical protein
VWSGEPGSGVEPGDGDGDGGPVTTTTDGGDMVHADGGDAPADAGSTAGITSPGS